MRRAREEMASQKRETFAQHRGMDPNASEECLVLLPARLNGRAGVPQSGLDPQNSVDI